VLPKKWHTCCQTASWIDYQVFDLGVFHFNKAHPSAQQVKNSNRTFAIFKDDIARF
jgi:hypothetical protein